MTWCCHHPTLLHRQDWSESKSFLFLFFEPLFLRAFSYIKARSEQCRAQICYPAAVTLPSDSPTWAMDLSSSSLDYRMNFNLSAVFVDLQRCWLFFNKSLRPPQNSSTGCLHLLRWVLKAVAFDGFYWRVSEQRRLSTNTCFTLNYY